MKLLVVSYLPRSYFWNKPPCCSLEQGGEPRSLLIALKISPLLVYDPI